MKKKIFTSLLLLSVFSLAGCSFEYTYFVPAYPSDSGSGGGGSSGQEDTGIEDAGTYDIKIWCDQRISDLTKTQVGNFVTNSSGKYKINLTVDELGEDSAASSMTEDVQSGADIFVFAQDQLSKLKTAGALAAITGSIAEAVTNETEADGVAAASLNGKLYAYPFTSDNGYFMYYDKSVIKESSIGNIEDIVNDCSAAGKQINYGIYGNGFYAASYFMATGCESKWEINASNKFYKYNDNYCSDNGLIAAKAVRNLKALTNAKGVTINASDDPSKFGKSLGVCISGIWNYGYALEALGDNLGCAPMPSYTVDGNKYHISSFSGYKLIGVKPQTDSKKVSVCKRLARYLSSQYCQTERFNAVNWGPTNKAALEMDVIKNQPGLKALREQKPYSKPQVQCPSSWFSSVSSLTSAISATSTDEDLWVNLQSYKDNLDSFLDD